MTALELVGELHARGIRLEADGDRLRYYPASALTLDLHEALVERKAELLTMLSKGTVKTISCPGDNCGADVVVIDNQGYCPMHRMTITIIEKIKC